MNNHVMVMSDSFETKKNTQASMITLGVAGMLLLIFIFVKFDFPKIETPIFSEVFEVNLGSGDVGSGKDQPLLPGEPAPSKQLAYNPPTPVKAVNDDSKDVETTEKADAPVITKPTVVKTNAKKIDNDNKVVKTNTKPQEVIANTEPKPKAVLGRTVGGNGNGGNGADEYKKGTGEGIAGGNGDQGRPGGSPNGTNYNGPVKNFGTKLVTIGKQNFQDDFDEAGKVALEIEVDADGKVVSAKYVVSGSTTSNRKTVDAAIRKAYQVKFEKTSGGQRGKFIFDMKVKV